MQYKRNVGKTAESVRTQCFNSARGRVMPQLQRSHRVRFLDLVLQERMKSRVHVAVGLVLNIKSSKNQSQLTASRIRLKANWSQLLVYHHCHLLSQNALYLLMNSISRQAFNFRYNNYANYNNMYYTCTYSHVNANVHQ